MTMITKPFFQANVFKFFRDKKWYWIIGGLIVLQLILFFLKKPVFDDDYSAVILDESGQICRVFLSENSQKYLPPELLDTIPDKLKIAVLTYEDQHFYHHPGINPLALFRAFKQNIQAGEVVSGGSTITMQVARLMHPKSRTYINKIIELFVSLKLELWYTKDDILRLYLTHAPYGSNIRGVSTAAYFFYNRQDIDALTWGQAATLAVLPNAPGLISVEKRHHVLIKKRNGLLTALHKKGIIDESTAELAKQEPIPNAIRTVPFYAPHFSNWLQAQSPKTDIFHTTLDLKLQKHIEQTVHFYAQSLQAVGIENVSVVVANTKTREIKAWIGSQDFTDTSRQGQVDGVIAPRSSGSILKPFLYAFAMDQGIILPETNVKDIPTFYGTFSPQNDKQIYTGIISAREALIRSLNIPSVRILNSVGVEGFYSLLKQAGTTTLFRPSDQYGLTLILGGAEVRLLDLVTLYAGLGNEGKFRDLTYLQTQSASKDTPLISEGASYLTLNILKDLKRPGTEFFWQLFDQKYPLSWKTGTSYGNRDAWAVGVSPEWTIGIWVGNFTGTENPLLGGARHAGPLLFDIFNYLPKNQNTSFFVKPTWTLKAVTLCKDTGYYATDSCPEAIEAEAPISDTLIKPCPYHHSIIVDTLTQKEVCSQCWTVDRYEQRILLIYPPNVRSILRQNGIVQPLIPQHNPLCPQFHEWEVMDIIYPAEGAHILIPRDFDGTYQPFSISAVHQDQRASLFWYINNDYKGKTTYPHQFIQSFIPGNYTVVIMDEDGHKSKRTFTIQQKR